MMKINRHSLIGVVLIMMMLATGCSTDEKTEPNQPPSVDNTPVTVASLFPLVENSYWKYQLEDDDKSIIEEKVVFNDDNRAQITVIDNATVMAIVYEFNKESDQLIAINSREEYYEEASILEETPRFRNVMLQGPIETGTNWVSDGLNYTITDIAATVEVPAGTFENCVVVEAKDEEATFSNTAYYQNGVGLVKEISQGDEYRKVKVLAEYQVN